jgi:hypothetical protein
MKPKIFLKIIFVALCGPGLWPWPFFGHSIILLKKGLVAFYKLV